MSIDQTMAGKGTAPPPGPIPPGLRVTLADVAGRTVAVTKTPFAIGRKEGDLVIPDATVSSRHAVIARDASGFVLVDQGSTNGTFVNGVQIHGSVAIENMDELRFGDITYGFNLVEDRFGMHAEERAAATADPTETLLIATAPSVATIPADKTILLHAETDGRDHAARLTLRITTVGRTEGDVVIGDQSLSRRHFQIEYYPDYFGLKDLGSANGTLVNGKPISYVRLQAGQDFTAGRTRFSLEIKG